MRWLRIREPNLYGYRTTLGDYGAEVVRAATNDWRAFFYKIGERAADTRQLTGVEVATFGGPFDTYDTPSQSMTRRRARLWLEARAEEAAAVAASAPPLDMMEARP
jgi:hypothetical protein